MEGNKDNKTNIKRFHLYRNLRQIIHGFDSYREGIARNFGVSGAALYLLVSIEQSPQCSYKDLAEYAGLAPNTVSSVIRSLIHQQFVTAVTDPIDRRIIRLNLTQAGSKMVEDTWNLLQSSSYAETDAQCTERVYRQLNQILNIP
ncbi:MarR family winged helix-turn-helix transcriptional regulator [Alicyclobacillus mengziensis]|uniref:MarR family transcriptional regulator n=1 Tax=Alicyclobacillus mengziensis TaxID=2931921 RepID=A0A9X7VZM3_9BACL|nr:MarR family transcriptional regulator [Alicyclobacillus mengziensis]QSO47442.1 MarR family transcriptional regulator [Alicyclobacillus mengziensis]